MFEHLLKNIACALDESKIPYMIIGGQAVLLYGSPRLTRDIDITLGIDTDRILLIEKICRSLKLKPLAPDPIQFAHETKVFPVEDPSTLIRVDFIFSFTPYEQQALKRVCEIELGGQTIKFASIEDVIIHKMLAGRAVDHDDVKNMLIKQKKKISFDYLDQWLIKFAKLDEHKNMHSFFKKLLEDAS